IKACRFCRGGTGATGKIEQWFPFRLLIECRQHHDVEINRTTATSVPIFKNRYMAAEQLLIDPVQAAGLEFG
ncbi:MAG TPA: hypothetical protein VIH43_03275, partial [Chthoniobacterales bacterium]